MKLTEEKQKQMERLRQGCSELSSTSDAPRKDYRVDGYQNLLNKYGTPQDNTEAYSYVPDGLVPDTELTRQYESNGLFAKIIDTPAEEVVKHDFNLGIEDEEVEGYIKGKLNDLDFEDKAATAIKWARLYGGSIIVMMIDDGNGLDQPVEWKKIRGIDELRVFERAIVQPDTQSLYSTYGEIMSNHPKSRFGEPEYYYVYSITGYFRVHESRCLIFRNGVLPELGMTHNYRFWGIPEYLRIKRQLRETVTAHGDSVKLLERSVQAIYKMKNLAQLLATDEGENQALKRLEIIDMARGILNSIAIDSEGEDYSFQTFSLSGVKEVIDSTCNMLSAITEIPQTVLFGRSPAGMSATGESDLENYYNYIDKLRKLMLKHNLIKIVDIVCKTGVKTGKLKEMPQYKLDFAPLWSLSETEQATVDQMKANIAQQKAATAQIYVDMGALDPSEVREGLKSSEDYVIEDLVDEDSPDITDNEMMGLLGGVVRGQPEQAPPGGEVSSPSGEETKQDAKGSVGVIVVRDGKVLCGKRRDGQGICGPGGHIEDGESPEEAAARETWEEFGITPTELLYIGKLSGMSGEFGEPHIFLSTAFSGDVQPNTRELENNAFTELQSLQNTSLFTPFAESLKFIIREITSVNDNGELYENTDNVHQKDFTNGRKGDIINSKGNEDGGPGSGKHSEGGANIDYATRATGANKFERGFSKNNLQNHAKHLNQQYSGMTLEQYEQTAMDLIQSPVGGDIDGYVRSNGQIVRYNKKTNDFVVGRPEQGIATMHKLYDGERYFQKQKSEQEHKE